MAALITSVMGNTDKVVEYIRECNSLNIEVLKPDINKSFSKFSVEGNNIRFGLAAVKNVGVNVINNIIAERETNGIFKDFADLAKRLEGKDSNKRVIESLIKCGAFDEISENRASLMYGYEKLLDSISMDRKKNVQGQISLFDSFSGEEENNKFQEIYSMPKIKEYEDKEKLNLEKEVLGMYVSGHPLSQYEEELRKSTSMDNGKLNAIKDNDEEFVSYDEKEVIMGGIVVNKNIKTTKRNDIMAFLELEDLYGTIEVIVFPQLLQRYNTILNEDSIIYVKGSLSIKEGENAKLIAREIRDINEKSSNNSKDGLYLKISSFNDKNTISQIMKISKMYPGNESIFLYSEDTKQLYKWNEIKINTSDNLVNELSKILPKQNIKIKK